MTRNNVLRKQPLFEGLHLIMKVFQDLSGGTTNIYLWMVGTQLLPYLDKVHQCKDIY